jgi:hypothetical protein
MSAIETILVYLTSVLIIKKAVFSEGWNLQEIGGIAPDFLNPRSLIDQCICWI